jgi:hypothetical protein
VLRLLKVVPDNNQHHLEGKAKEAWRAFEAAVPDHPFADVPVEHGPAHNDEVGAIAIAIPHFDRADGPMVSGAIALGERFWSGGHSEEDRILTLLHESIHLRLFDEKPERTVRSQQIRSALIRASDVAFANEKRDVAQFKQQRAWAAIKFHLWPDEVWAELYLRDRYPQWFERRVAGLCRMREDMRRREAQQLIAIPERIRGSLVAYELVRLDMVLGLERDTQRRHRLEVLKQAWKDDLSRMFLPAELADFEDAFRIPLESDAVFEARCDRYCNAVLSIAP